MTDINVIAIVGRLTRDAEKVVTSSGSTFYRFSIANNYSKKKGDKWEDEVSYLDVVLNAPENIGKYLVKGKKVALNGSLRQQRWEQDGQQRSAVKIAATSIQLLDSAPKEEKSEKKSIGPENIDDEIPF